ncbi:LOW QUALITY PROTEIN: ribosomal RNA small subunit methyltransferase C [Bacillus sp. JCM 19046]|nr:LOW QUALITY PROTEIN: ribosomal RNA small subunit methyltransferase C [Bacillus sp. JCM 19046]
MSDHYYTNKPTSESDERTWAYQLKGERFSFITDRGVFSKNEVDFGSKLLIESIDLPKVQGAILDVGCGYGPIGLALGKTNPERKVVMIDVNERACELAEKNAQKNGVENAEVRFMETGMLELNEQELFAMVVTNLPIRAGKSVVHGIYESAYKHLLSKGILFVVIQKKQGAPSTRQKLEELFGVANVELIEKNKGYFIFSAQKN